MSEKIIQFTKFIIRTIFRGVTLRDSSENMSLEDIYIFHKRKLNSDILNSIFEEGKKYGYDKERCLAEVKLADEKIVISPSIEKIETNFSLCNLARGNRLSLHYDHPDFGEVIIDGIVNNDRALIVLKSNISGLQYRDVLYPAKLVFISGEKNYYRIRRGKKELTSPEYMFVPGKLKYVETYTPSLIFNILDNDSSFHYEESMEVHLGSNVAIKREKTLASMRYSIGDKYYASFYSNDKRKTWRDNELISEEECKDITKFPFIIFIKGSKKAMIKVNPFFKFSKKKSHTTYEINKFHLHCEINGSLEADCEIKTLKDGILERDVVDGWNLSQKIHIDCFNSVNPKTFKIVSEAILKVLRTVITIDDLDVSLLKLGATFPFKVSLIQEMREIGKIELTIAGADFDKLVTVRDLYNLLDNRKYGRQI